jgi:MFS family permease
MIVRANPRRNLAVLCLASMGWAFSFGLGAELAPLWLRDSGCNGQSTGLNTSTYYLGVALASVGVPWLMRRAGWGCVVVGMALDAVTTAAFPWVQGEGCWLVLRLLGGAGTALSLIPMETLVNHNAPPERRGRDFGVYAVSVALGIALGAVIGLPLYPRAPRAAFALGGLVTLLAAAVAGRGLTVPALPAEERGASQPLPLRAGLLSFGTAWAQGFLEGGMMTFLAPYLLALRYHPDQASALVGGLFLGVILAQLPLGRLADRLGRLRVLLACHAVVLTGLGWVPFCTAPLGLAPWLFVLGACCGALYPLGLALLGERVPPAGLARANAWYLACNCAGSLTGPAVIGKAIDHFGWRAQFPVGASAVLLVLGTWLLVGLSGCWSRRRAKPRQAPRRAARVVERFGGLVRPGGG